MLLHTDAGVENTTDTTRTIIGATSTLKPTTKTKKNDDNDYYLKNTK